MAAFINEALDGVVTALHQAFPNYPVYDEQVEQGLETPSFYVRCVRPLQERYRGERFLVEQFMEIVFFPYKGNTRVNNNVIETLFSILEVIRAGDDLIRGTSPNVNINDEDGTVVFTIMYRYFARRVEQRDPMETLYLNDGVLVNNNYLTDENNHRLEDDGSHLIYSE